MLLYAAPGLPLKPRLNDNNLLRSRFFPYGRCESGNGLSTLAVGGLKLFLLPTWGRLWPPLFHCASWCLRLSAVKLCMRGIGALYRDGLRFRSGRSLSTGPPKNGAGPPIWPLLALDLSWYIIWPKTATITSRIAHVAPKTALKI